MCVCVCTFQNLHLTPSSIKPSLHFFYVQSTLMIQFNDVKQILKWKFSFNLTFPFLTNKHLRIQPTQPTSANPQPTSVSLSPPVPTLSPPMPPSAHQCQSSAHQCLPQPTNASLSPPVPTLSPPVPRDPGWFTLHQQ